MTIASYPVGGTSVLDRKSIIQNLLTRLRGQTYLEIGVELGQSLLPIRAKTKLGVDPNPIVPWRGRITMALHNLFSSEKVRLLQMTSDEFFANRESILQGQTIDVALVDGLHTYEQAYQDVIHCLEVLSPNGVIVMHDCNPATERMALRAHSHAEALQVFPQDGDTRWCGDVWKSVVMLRSFHADLRTFVLDADYGLGIVTRGPSASTLPFSLAEIQPMTYNDLAAQREYLLDLRPPSAFDAFLESHLK